MNAVVQQMPADSGRRSLVAKMAERFNVEPTKMMDTLKKTAFKGDVSNEQMMALLVVADQYGLNPWTKEVYAFPDKNNGIVPVVGVDGWSRIINSHPAYDGMEFVETDDACTCVIYRKDRQHPTKVTEYLSECKRATGPWGSHPKRMLRHKAMIQCARVAFGYVGIYDQDEAERIVEGEARVVSTSADDLNTIIQKQQPAISDATPARQLPPSLTYAQYEEKLRAAADPEVRAIILDEARTALPADQAAELAEAFKG